MKRLAVIALMLAACEQQSESKLNSSKPADPGPVASGDVNGRLQKLEQKLARYEEALEFLQKVYDQNKQQQQAQEANEPDPDAMFAVDISGAMANNQYEGPAGALVTIVEAWDFA